MRAASAVEGYSDRILAQLLGVSTSFVRDWKRAFKVGGIAGIKLGYQGAIGKLTAEQRREIIEWLKAKDYWHLDELINHLEDKYEVVYKSKQSYYDLFEAGKIRWKRSQKVNPQFDEELVKKKRTEINDFLAKHKTESVAVHPRRIETGAMAVLFIDECHLLNGDICGYVWGPEVLNDRNNW